MITLNGAWKLREAASSEWMPATVPGSVYADYLDAGKMEDPFWRDNELKAFDMLEKDYVYARTFEVGTEDLAHDALLLTCEGLDTLAEVRVNDMLVLHANNMHRTWRTDVAKLLTAGTNRIEITFRSPNKWIKEAYEKSPTDGSSDCTVGFPLLRKAHCMYGWDWGPRLPDAGIWRNIYIQPVDTARLDSVRIHQEHTEGKVTLSFFPDIEFVKQAETTIRATVTAPDGKVFVSEGDVEIDAPQLWWPNGIGAQPLYTVKVELLGADGNCIDTWERRIGLRTMTMRRVKDEWGESFDTCVNGKPIFAMGADYIPEDNILRRVTPERTYALLKDAALANYNSVRVWGGGYYPDDWFFDACDELGLIVWEDFMFACAVYDLSEEFEENICAEITQNVRRLRHHASLGLWCGNNEMEEFVAVGEWVRTMRQKADYIKMYEYLFPKIVKKESPDVFYWPASPSSGGSFDDPMDPNRGDMHYWDVWHGNKPFTEYRKFFFRYASEFGFQSFPCLKTVESFTLPQDRNIFSRVMEKHQRNDAANGKIMNYIAQTFLYPGDFGTLLYASQLLQAEAMRYGVEHWRRNRGRCMGAIVWQLNDCWPVASWSSIDYFGRWKALHYFEKRFFAPVLLSCCEEGTLTQRTNANAELKESAVEKSIRLNVSNETLAPVDVTVKWALRAADGTVKRAGEESVSVDALSAVWMDKIIFEDAELFGDYASFEMWRDGEKVSCGTVLFCAPKHFNFVDPELTVEKVSEDTLRVSAKAYARQIEIECEDGDVLFDDNYFDLNADSRLVHIIRGNGENFKVRSVYDIR